MKLNVKSPALYHTLRVTRLQLGNFGCRSRIVDDLVSKAVSSGVDGVIMDYEPTEEYTREHALVYR